MAEASPFPLSQEGTTHHNARVFTQMPFPPEPAMAGISKAPEQKPQQVAGTGRRGLHTLSSSGPGLTLHGRLVDLAVLRQPLCLRVLATQRAVHSILQAELGGGVRTVALPAPEDGQGELLPGKERKRST